MTLRDALDDQEINDTHRTNVVEPDERREDHLPIDTHLVHVDPSLIVFIRRTAKQRRLYLALKNRPMAALGAFVRSHMGWSKTNSKAENEAIRKRAAKLIADVERGRKSDDPLAAEMSKLIGQVVLSVAPSAESARTLGKEMEKLARQLPVYAWAKSIRGLGDQSLADIVAEAGDLSEYDSPAKLWKRMGLAVIDGGRQRRIKDVEKAALHGYSPRRRSVMWTVGDCMVRARGYRPEYEARKAHVAAMHPDWSKAHVDNDARRYITKRLLRDLWRAWRQEATVLVSTDQGLPPAA